MKRLFSFITTRPNILISLIFIITFVFQNNIPVLADSEVWIETGQLNSPKPYHTATVLLDGKVLIAGGYDGSLNTASSEIYDPTSGTWSTTDSMNVARKEHQSILLTDGQVLVAGGEFSTGISELFYLTDPPVSNAGPDQSVYTLEEVTLDGSASIDPNGYVPLTYFWTQTGGVPVQLDNATMANPSFTAPSDPDTIIFSLTVTNSLGIPDPIGDEVSITIRNQAPVSNAGPDQSVNIFSPVTLDGSGSADIDGDLPLNYLWLQTSGIEVTLSDTSTVTPTFTAPSESSILKFNLIVWDSLGVVDTTPDEVIIHIQEHLLSIPLILR